MNCLQFCRWTVFNSVGELSSKCVSVNCPVGELSRFLPNVVKLSVDKYVSLSSKLNILHVPMDLYYAIICLKSYTCSIGPVLSNHLYKAIMWLLYEEQNLLAD